MKGIFRSQPVLTEETHRVTSVELFFDLVFVFALVRIASFMAQAPTPTTLLRALVLLALLWFAFQTYIWLGNQARADLGLVRAGMLVAMAAIFVAALVIPDAWGGYQTASTALILALAYIVTRGVHLLLFYYVSAGDERLRRQARLLTIPVTLGWIPLIAGAVLGGTAQTVLWATTILVVDGGASRLVARFFGGPLLRSPGHFAERFGLVMIIALGESLISVGAGAGSKVTRWPVLIAALLSVTTSACLWWLYFENAASPARRALEKRSNERRIQMANSAYALCHLLLITGIIYLALGLERVVSHLANDPPGRPAGTPLGWTETVALYGGAAVYLTGRTLFLQLTVRSTPPAHIVATAITLALLPIGRQLPALGALGLLTAFLIALVVYELGHAWEKS